MFAMNKWLCLFFVSLKVQAAIWVGTGVADITPAVGTPSAGYSHRVEAMVGSHDPLLATALYIESEGTKVAICGVDHLGFDYRMVQEVRERVRKELSSCEILIASSHTHSGGGAYLDIPIVGRMVAGEYDPEVRKLYIDGAVQAILDASRDLRAAKIGYGEAVLEGLTRYKSQWPEEVTPMERLNLIKVTSLEDEPIVVLFNFAMNPTALMSDNLLFSADFVGVAREVIEKQLGAFAVFVNGAQAELVPHSTGNQWADCERTGLAIAKGVVDLWEEIETKDVVEITFATRSFEMPVCANPFGMRLPLYSYPSEINLMLFDGKQAYLTVPGELSCLYEGRLLQAAKELGYENLVVFGITNDEMGFILGAEAWEHKTRQSRLSFGGPDWGEKMYEILCEILADR